MLGIAREHSRGEQGIHGPLRYCRDKLFLQSHFWAKRRHFLTDKRA